MNTHPIFVVFITLAGAIPALAQTPSAVGTADSKPHSSASIPDFTRIWTHPAFPWFEPPASGPGPITNLSRWPEQRPSGMSGSAALPPSKVGVSNYDQLVGDYKNPILQPSAAAVVKKFGEMSLTRVDSSRQRVFRTPLAHLPCQGGLPAVRRRRSRRRRCGSGRPRNPDPAGRVRILLSQ